ncbi:MAG: hypothetical protein PHW54_05715, partial [Candidatus Omnitrophica bacterium]|nr:hypothetical protein [Candidatus Omnitrophota bacterium]
VTEKTSGCLIAVAIILIVTWFIMIIGILAAIAIPNLVRAKLVANESAAQVTAKTISTALELYAVDNNGNYPSEEGALAKAKSPYLSTSYNNKIIQGYSYSLKLKPNGYKVIAKPSECRATGNKIFQIETGGVISEERCQ